MPLVPKLALSAESAPGNEPGSAEPGYNDERILGIIPNYTTVSDPNSHVAPLTAKEKWKLFARGSLDPFNEASALLGAGLSQMGNDDPKYGNGGKAYAKRFGAAVTDFATQSFFTEAVFACILHQDPRYYRKGPSAGVAARTWYAVTRSVVTRQDSGRPAFNFSNVLGMSLGIAASNLYYPRASVNGPEVASRFGSSMMGGALGNLLPEFWPDIRAKVFHRKSERAAPPLQPSALR